MNKVDWTDKWDQNEVAGEATLLVDKILLRIYESKLEIHSTFNFTSVRQIIFSP